MIIRFQFHGPISALLERNLGVRIYQENRKIACCAGYASSPQPCLYLHWVQDKLENFLDILGDVFPYCRWFSCFLSPSIHLRVWCEVINSLPLVELKERERALLDIVIYMIPTYKAESPSDCYWPGNCKELGHSLSRYICRPYYQGICPDFLVLLIDSCPKLIIATSKPTVLVVKQTAVVNGAPPTLSSSFH